MKKLILVFLLTTGLLVGMVGTASAETVGYEVFAVLTGLAPNATEDEESIIVIYAVSIEGIWADTIPFVASGPGSEEVLDTALSANSMGASLFIITDDIYLEEESMPIYQIFTTIKPVEAEDEDEEETDDTEAFGREAIPEIIKDVGNLNRF